MYNNIKTLNLPLAFCILVLIGCKEEKVGPLPSSESIPPPVSNINVENMSGGAKITYTVPSDPNMLYIKAIWEINGVERTAKSSVYTDALLLEGFGDTKEYKVKLYSVSTAEKISSPVEVTVKPLKAPVQQVFESLKVIADFGGINTSFLNPSGGNVIINILTKDGQGNLIPTDKFYTSITTGAFSTRGFNSTARDFAVFVKDRWNNTSDTLFTRLTPIFEAQLNKSLFKEVMPYPGDINTSLFATTYPMKNLWDNNLTNFYHSAYGTGMPESFTINLGAETKLSRLKYYQRISGSFYYSSACPKIFEIWGANNPDVDGGWNNWTKLMVCESTKPSGLPVGTITNEDKAKADAGEDFTFPVGVPAVRYLRIRIMETWAKTDYIHFNELTFWGGN
jgi:hypothetical protein